VYVGPGEQYRRVLRPRTTGLWTIRRRAGPTRILFRTRPAQRVTASGTANRADENIWLW